ncbi:MAG: alpha/beta hydrolase [Chlamydiota bacterium]|nr:alpha/beta hydrolase [Chlamydiota bacterium]
MSLLWLTLFLVLGFVFYIVYFFFRAIKPRRFVCPIIPEHYGVACQRVSIHTCDAIELAGWFIPCQKQAPAIIICHSYPNDKGDAFMISKFLAKHFNLLLFDFRAHGQSGGHYCTFGLHETVDLEAAIHWLQDHNMNTMGLFGMSMGATVCMMKEYPSIKAMVLDSGYISLESIILNMFNRLGILRMLLIRLLNTLGKIFLKNNVLTINTVASMNRTSIPVFIIHGLKDQRTPVEQARQLKEAYPMAELWLVPDAEHLQAYETCSDEYADRVTSFFLKNLSAPLTQQNT